MGPTLSGYHRELGHTLNYEFAWLPEDSDGQVRVSIARMIDLILADVNWPIIQERALSVLAVGGGDPILGVWRTIKGFLQFRQDAEIAAGLVTDDPRIADVVEVFIRPVDQELLIRLNGYGIEDCDGFELYAACLLVALGVKCSLVTVNANSRDPRRYSHVYLAAYVDGRRITLDFSHGPYPGWECQNLGRLREWPVEHSKYGSLAVCGAAILAGWLIGSGKMAEVLQ